MVIRARVEIDGETWVVVVDFGAMIRGPQYDWTPAIVTRDGEGVVGTADGAVPAEARWVNTFGGEPKDWAFVDNGCLWAPGVLGVRPNTARAFERLTLAVQQAVWAGRGPGRARPSRQVRNASSLGAVQAGCSL